MKSTEDNCERADRLYALMTEKGYPEDFARLVAREMCTEYTIRRMYGYLAACPRLPLDQVADELLGIQAERDRLRDKHMAQHAQETINRMYREKQGGPSRPAALLEGMTRGRSK